MNFFNKVKDGLKDPKKKALTQLCLYGIFFLFVFILIGMGNNLNNIDYNDYIDEDITNEVLSYEYVYKINNNDVINEIIGTLKDNKDIFNYNGLNYIKKDGVVYLNDSVVTIDFDVDRYKYKNIEVIIENSDSKTTYNDSNKIVYNMSVDEYFTLLNEINDCSTIDCSVINVPITIESNKYINHVLIDLSNYYGYKYIIEINYNNINKISTN